MEPATRPPSPPPWAPLAEAVAVPDAGRRRRALELMKADDAGRVGLLRRRRLRRAGGSSPVDRAGAPRRPETPRGPSRRTVVEASRTSSGAVRALLAAVVVVEDLQAAARVITAGPELTAVTREGDIFTVLSVARGLRDGARRCWKSRPPSTTTAPRLAAVTAAAERAGSPSPAPRRAGTKPSAADAALDRLHESDARLAAVAERLGQLGSALRSAAGESERLAAALAAAEANIVTEQQALAEVAAARLAAGRRGSAGRGRTVHRNTAMRWPRRRRGPVRGDGGPAGAAQRRGAADSHPQPGGLAGTRRRHRTPGPGTGRGAGPPAPAAGAQGAPPWPPAVEQSLPVHGRLRGTGRARNATRRREPRAAGGASCRPSAPATMRWPAELARADRLGAPGRAGPRPAAAADRGPGNPVHRGARADPGRTWWPISARTSPCRSRGGVDGQVGGAAGAGGRRRRRRSSRASRLSARSRRSGSSKAERDLSALGKVNPLALEEFAALEERHQFLSTQLEDLKSSRKDLLDIIKEVDERVQQVFAEAFEDTAGPVRAGVRPAVPRRRGPAGPDRPVGHAHHRHRGGGPAGRQEDQAAVAALRRRAVADRGGPAGGDLQGPARRRST